MIGRTGPGRKWSINVEPLKPAVVFVVFGGVFVNTLLKKKHGRRPPRLTGANCQ